jgi:hypothetical protein
VVAIYMLSALADRTINRASGFAAHTDMATAQRVDWTPKKQ